MLPIAYYFLQVMLCSGVMMGYYWLVLRNKRFHQYNRFYILAVTLLAWIVPLIKISWSHPVVVTEGQPQVMQLLSVVADNNTAIEQTIVQQGQAGFQWSWDLLATGIYITVAATLLFGIIRALVRLYRLLKTNSCKNIGDVYLVLTTAQGTPFSFFRYIFWNEEIDIRTQAGKQILQHELTHVKQKHSFDRLFMQLVLVIGWFNPFFWLMRKEMEMIHEFIADKKAVRNGDAASLAEMLLTATYPQQKFLLTQPFFFSPIKRRLQMLANNRNPRFSYLRRLVVLPLLAVVTVLFAFRNKDEKKPITLSLATVMENVADAITTQLAHNDKEDGVTIFNNASLDRVYTVVLSVGHGGKDPGFTAQDGTAESELNLLLAKTIKDLNTNPNIKIALTRNDDEVSDPKKAVETVNELHPDLVISLHCNGRPDNAAPSMNGLEIYIPSAENAHYSGSVMLANNLLNAMKELNIKLVGIKNRYVKKLKILELVSSPAVTVNAGYLSNLEDLKKLKDEHFRSQMAGSILRGINNYLRGSVLYQKAGAVLFDTLPTTSGSNPLLLNKPQPLIVLDGKKLSITSFAQLDPVVSPDQIASITVLKNETAIEKYGEEGKNGVILITTKNAKPDPADTAKLKRFSFPLGELKSSPRNDQPSRSFLITDSLGDVKWKSLTTPIIDHTSANVDLKITGGKDVALAPNTNTMVTIDVPGLDKGSPTLVVPQESNTGWKIYSSWVDEPGKVKIRFANTTDKTIAVKGDQYKIVLVKEPVSKTEQVSAITVQGRPLSGADKGAIVSETLNSLYVPGTIVGGTFSGTLHATNVPLDESKGTKPVNNLYVPGTITGGTFSGTLRATNQPQDDPVTVVGHKIVPGRSLEPLVVQGRPIAIKVTPARYVDSITVSDANYKPQPVAYPQSEITPPAFPGGLSAWARYLVRVLNTSIPGKNGAAPGKYTVVVAFDVSEDGSVNNVRAQNDPGYGTMEEAIRVIVKGPKWKPAMQDGKNIKYTHKVSITFDVNAVKTPAPQTTAYDWKYQQEFGKKLEEAKKGNTKSYFIIDGRSCIAFNNGYLSLDEITDIIFMNGKRITVDELNSRYNRDHLYNGLTSPAITAKLNRAAFVLSDQPYKDDKLVTLTLQNIRKSTSSGL